jgi:cytochrome c-type biogenesis protein CcmF
VIDHGVALAMFCFGSFVVASVVQEFFRGVRARQAMTREIAPVALGRLVRRNRRRYGGYIVHAGVAVALIGIAASTSFQHSRTANLKPGQSVRLDGYDLRYVRPTATATAQKISLGAILDVSRNGRHVTTLHTQYGLYPAQDPMHQIGRFFNGSNESRVGLDAGLTHDIWTVISPNITPLQGLISKGDVVLGRAINQALTLPAAQRDKQLSTLYAYRDVIIRSLTQRYVAHPWSASFLLIVSPLVTWLWLGAILAALGGLIALWPMPGGPRRMGPRARVRTPDPETVPEPAQERVLV